MKIEIRPENREKVYIDFIKICAILMVMFNHTGTRGFMLFTVRQQSSFFMFYLFHSIFIKIAVPLFFMASGALLLGREETARHLLVHRFLRFLVVLLIGSAAQYLYACYVTKPQSPSLSGFLTGLYTGGIIEPYWFLYAYLAFILILPLLRRLANAMTARDYQWMFLLFGLMKMLSVFEFLIWRGAESHSSHFSFFFVANIVFYPLMGFYIDRIMKDRQFNAKTLALLSAASIISILVCCYMTRVTCTMIGEWQESTCQIYFKTLIFLPSVTAFYAVRMLFLRHRPKEKNCRLISTLGAVTFGVFLFENIYRRITLHFLKPFVTNFPACWIWVLSSFVLGACVTFVLRLIPWIRKLI